MYFYILGYLFALEPAFCHVHDHRQIAELLAESSPVRESITDELQFDEYGRLLKVENETYYTTASGKIVPDPYHVRTAGPYGPMLLEDFPFRQILGHFDREKIPERIVHARGTGAFGYFECTNPEARNLTVASPFEFLGKKTKVAVRLSTSHGSSGSPDTKFDLRGFAVKFYTETGNWDLTMLSAPAFFIRDPIKLPNLVHSSKSDPQTGCFNYDRFWEFLSLQPESLLAVTMAFAGRASTKGFRHVDGFSVNTYKFINDKNQFWFIRFKMAADAGPTNLTLEGLNRLYSEDLDYGTRDLHNSIKNKRFPSWKLYVQAISPEKARKMSFNILDTTKEWPEEEIKPIELGKMVLNQNPDNFFASVEQMAFNPANTIPGIDFTFDKMLQGRLFAYQDTQFYRLGVNYYSLPVNKPIVKVFQPNIRDGLTQFGENSGSLPDYIPNSEFSIKLGKPARYIVSMPSELEISRFNTDDDDNYSQVRAFWKRSDEATRALLIHNMARHISKAKASIRGRFLGHVKIASESFYNHLVNEISSLKQKILAV